MKHNLTFSDAPLLTIWRMNFVQSHEQPDEIPDRKEGLAWWQERFVADALAILPKEPRRAPFNFLNSLNPLVVRRKFFSLKLSHFRQSIILDFTVGQLMSEPWL